MRAYWIVSIDTAHSQGLPLNDAERGRFYAVLYHHVEFLAHTIGPSRCDVVWAGEGGFAVCDADSWKAGDALLFADTFVRSVSFYFTDGILLTRTKVAPAFRITIGQVNAEPSLVPETMASKHLSILLKHERDFGKAGTISILGNVYEQLTHDQRVRFLQRQATVHGHVVYDRSVLPRVGPSDLAAQVLEAKNRIDLNTIHWLRKVVKGAVSGVTTARDAFEAVFTPRELLEEIMTQVHCVLVASYEGHRFRVAYAKPDASRTHLVVQQHHGGEETVQFISPIPIGGRYSASIAWTTKEPVLVESVEAELRKGAKKRNFGVLIDGNSRAKSVIGSIACVPVTDDAGVQRGVLCIDTPTPSFLGPHCPVWVNSRPGGPGSSPRDGRRQGALRLLRFASALRVPPAAPRAGLRQSNEKRGFSFGERVPSEAGGS